MEIKMWTKIPMEENIAKYLLKDRNKVDKEISKLIEGLDRDSVETVYRIVSRLQRALMTDNEPVLQTKVEKEECEKITSEFEPNIYIINQKKYYYSGYFLPIFHFEISVFWHKHSMNVFSKNTLEKIQNSDIIDVGGFIGDSALIFREFTKQKIHTFEATSKNFTLMQKTLELNESSQIIANKLALGDKKGTLTFNYFGSGSSAMHGVGSKTEEVEVDTLDNYVAKNNVKVGFIKVDIEGSENLFLQGALETIRTQKPAMLISIYHHPEQFFGIKPFLESLNLGYTFKIHKPVDYTIACETALFCEVL